MKFVIYKINTGKIRSVLDAFNSDSISLMDGEAYLEVPLEISVELTTDYVSEDSLQIRPLMPITQDGNNLIVPENTEFSVVGSPLEGLTDDGTLEFEFSEPGTYVVALRKFPYLDAEVTLEG
jgi:hypothetical protein